jgi:carboxypeptidase C (cathepsin A)
MSSVIVGYPVNKIKTNSLNETDLIYNIAISKKLKHNTKSNKKITKVSNKIRPESALFTMIKLLVEHRDQINITNSVLSINANDLDLVQKLNYCMEFLAHIPFSFQYDKCQTKILLDLFHLEEEMNLINNLEFNVE